ncbi:hypothetical protein ACFWPX_20205 [Nocardia sp. NPDC058518]|uniref:hypothetical protein n=1 Tax=Nocardia sp. NPDC058518 TaxID=3346534 RepID=UPI00364BA46B
MTDPDVSFTLAATMSTAAAPQGDTAERTTALSHRIAREVARLGPPGWVEVEASFAMTAAAEITLVVFGDGEDRIARVFPTDEILAMLREHRHLSASFGDGPWWRYLLSMTSEGRMDVDYDYGDEPFPDDQLFPPTVYRTDMEIYPRERLPVWLAAYLNHGDRQVRTPRLAAEQARADAAAGTVATRSAPDVEFPALPEMTSRWALIAAAFVAVESDLGPRAAPAFLVFEGTSRGGATLCKLPGDRAVLSGGVWDAPELDAAYNGVGTFPQLYRGAPSWVADVVLNRRAANGLLTFCYWWEGGHWHRGDSPRADDLAGAVPGVWSAQTVVDVIASRLGDAASAAQLAAIPALVRAAEQSSMTHELLSAVFPGTGFDVDGAWFQLTVAGLTTERRAEVAADA